MYTIESIIEKLGPPIGKADTHLRLELMDPKIFESFCYELIKKKIQNKGGKIVDAMMIGTPGQSQFGGDIFSHHQLGDQDCYSLYQVKRYNTFRVGDYISAVECFHENRKKWQVDINNFYIFISDKTSAKLIAEYKVQDLRFKQLKIEHRIIDKEIIHDWIKDLYCPKLLYRFFHESWVTLFYGEQALLDIKRFGIWDYQESSTWKNYTQPYTKTDANTFILQNDYVLIQAFLPNLKGNTLSCFIDLRNGRYRHVLLTINQNSLLSFAFEGVGSPADAEVRPWIFKDPMNSHYYCDIGNCRLTLTLKETTALCDAFDELWYCYKQRMEEIERICCSANFSNRTPLGDNTHLITIPLWLWQRINVFCQRHDYLDTEGEWSIFNPLPEHIMVFTRHKDETMNEGHHVTVMAIRDPNDNSINNQDIALIWQPPSSYDLYNKEEDSIGPRNYWDALTTYFWLIEKLIPTADSWYCANFFPERHRWQLLPFFRSRHTPYRSHDIHSYYQAESNITAEQVNSKQSLLELLTKLQRFYNDYNHQIYFQPKEFERFCEAFLFLLRQTTVNYWGYIRGSVDASQDNLESVIITLQKYQLESQNYTKNLSLYDYLLRGMMALFGDGDCHINEAEAQKIAMLLCPFVDKMYEKRFLQRCQMRL